MTEHALCLCRMSMFDIYYGQTQVRLICSGHWQEKDKRKLPQDTTGPTAGTDLLNDFLILTQGLMLMVTISNKCQKIL